MRNDYLRLKYPYIVKWGYMIGSYDYYIENQLEKAEAENAPTNATYRAEAGWCTTVDIQSEQTRHTLGLPPLTK